MTESRAPVQRGTKLLKRVALCACLLAGFSLPAAGDVSGAINAVRAAGCPAHPGAASPLLENNRLDDAARWLSRGMSLENATAKAGYRALSSTSVHITNVLQDRDIERLAGSRFCVQIAD